MDSSLTFLFQFLFHLFQEDYIHLFFLHIPGCISQSIKQLVIICEGPVCGCITIVNSAGACSAVTARMHFTGMSFNFECNHHPVLLCSVFIPTLVSCHPLLPALPQVYPSVLLKLQVLFHLQFLSHFSQF